MCRCADGCSSNKNVVTPACGGLSKWQYPGLPLLFFKPWFALLYICVIVLADGILTFGTFKIGVQFI